MVLQELLVNITIILIVVPISGAMGLVSHEILHWITGYMSRGDPSFTNWRLKMPGAVDFGSPHSMSNRQVRLVGGVVFIFPVFLILFALLTTPSDIRNNPVLMGGLAFLFGGSVISETDIIAVRSPEAWKKLASGEAIDLGDLGY